MSLARSSGESYLWNKNSMEAAVIIQSNIIIIIYVIFKQEAPFTESSFHGGPVNVITIAYITGKITVYNYKKKLI